MVQTLFLLAARFLSSPARAEDPDCGKPLCVFFGTGNDSRELAGNIVHYLSLWIGFVCVAIFIYGALLLTASGAHDEWKNKGKGIMIGSLVGMTLVLGAYAILQTVGYFIAL